MQRRFILNLTFVIFLNLIIKPFWILGIDRNVQNILGSEQYGLYFSLLGFTLLFNILLDFGITNYNQRNIAFNAQNEAQLFSETITLKLLLCLLYIITCEFFAFAIGYSTEQFRILQLIVINQIFVSGILYFRSIIAGKHFFWIDSLLSVADKLLMIIFCSILLFTKKLSPYFTIYSFIFAQMLAYTIVLITASTIVFKKANYPKKIHLNWPDILARLKETTPYALLVILMSLYSRIDTVMIERLLPQNGKLQVGIYAQSFRLFDAYSMFGVLFAGLLLPMFSRLIKKGQKITPLFTTALKLIFFPSLWIASVSFIYSDYIIKMLYSQNFPHSIKIFQVLMVSFIFVSTSYILGTLLTAKGELKTLNTIAFIALVINIILNILAIPWLYALGSALTSLFTQIIVTIVQFFVVKKSISLYINIKTIIKWGIASILIVFTIYATSYLKHKTIAIGISLSITICIILLSKLISLNKIRGLLERTKKLT